MLLVTKDVPDAVTSVSWTSLPVDIAFHVALSREYIPHLSEGFDEGRMVAQTCIIKELEKVFATGLDDSTRGEAYVAVKRCTPFLFQSLLSLLPHRGEASDIGSHDALTVVNY